MTIFSQIRKSELAACCRRHAKEWRDLGQQARGTPEHIASFEATAKSFELEAETGVGHCTCHLLPYDKCRKLNRRS